MAIVVDSSPLICLAKIGRLDLLRLLYELVIIPQEVHHEVVVEGKRLGKSGVDLIQDGINSGWIKTVTLTRRQSLAAEQLEAERLGKGEAAALALASHRRLLVILDDRRARDLANVLRLDYIGSAAVLLHAFRRRHLDRRGFLKALEDLGAVMWLSPEITARLIQLAEEREV